jgi:hypothetical protein
MFKVSILSSEVNYIVTCKSIFRKSPQHTLGQKYWNSVFFVSAVTSPNSG